MTSEQIGDLADAMAKAQASLEDPIKDKVATVPTKGGGSYSYAYADLGSYLKVARPAFGSNGIAIVQGVDSTSSNTSMHVSVSSRLVHSSGQWIESTISAVVVPSERQNPIQVLGSTTSYLRRYGLSALIGMFADIDSDASESFDNTALSADQCKAMWEAWPDDKAMKRIAARFHVTRYEDIPAVFFDDAMKVIEMLRAKNEAKTDEN